MSILLKDISYRDLIDQIFVHKNLLILLHCAGNQSGRSLWID